MGVSLSNLSSAPLVRNLGRLHKGMPEPFLQCAGFEHASTFGSLPNPDATPAPTSIGERRRAEHELSAAGSSSGTARRVGLFPARARACAESSGRIGESVEETLLSSTSSENAYWERVARQGATVGRGLGTGRPGGRRAGGDRRGPAHLTVREPEWPVLLAELTAAGHRPPLRPRPVRYHRRVRCRVRRPSPADCAPDQPPGHSPHLGTTWDANATALTSSGSAVRRTAAS